MNENGIIRHKKYTLQVDAIDELSKTKSVIIAHLYACLREYGLREDEVKIMVHMVHDRGGNIRYGIKDEGIAQNFCYDHLINNLAGATLEVPCVKDHVKAAGELTSYMKNSGLCKHPKSTLKKNGPTRWNSVYMMMSSIVDNFERIVEVLTEKQTAVTTNISRQAKNRSQSQSQLQRLKEKQPIDYLGPIDINAIAAIAEFLKVFTNLTVRLEGYLHLTQHMVWPAFIKIKSIFASIDIDDDDNIIEQMKAAGDTYFQENLADFKPRESHKIAVVLHPLMKNMRNFSYQEKEDAHALVRGKLRALLVKTKSEPGATTSTEPSPKRQKINVDDFMAEFIQPETHSVSNADASLIYSNELEHYLDEDVKWHENLDPIEWWQKKR